MKKIKKKLKCEAATPFCSGELIVKYSVNGSAKEGVTFHICGPCKVRLEHGGAKLKQVFEGAQ